MDYQPFLEPRPTRVPRWYEHHEWASDTYAAAGFSFLTTVGVLIGGLVLALVIAIIGATFTWHGALSFAEGLSWVAVIVAALAFVVTLALLLAAAVLLPNARRQAAADYVRALRAWEARRSQHISLWERRVVDGPGRRNARW